MGYPVTWRAVRSLALFCSLSIFAENAGIQWSPALQAGVDSIFMGFERLNIPGCSVGVFRRGEVLYSRGYGIADLETGVPLRDTSVFDIASISKQFTAMAIAILEERGQLSIRNPLRRYLRHFPRIYSNVTIADLIYHRSGMRDYLSIAHASEYPDYFTIPQALNLIQRQRGLNFSVGSNYSYSNTGYFLLGLIVNEVSGQSLAQFSEHEIFSRLGMRDTHIHDNNQRPVANLAKGYWQRSDGKGYDQYMTMLEMVGDGSILTTVRDLAQWDENFYDNRLGRRRRSLIRSTLRRGRLSNGRLLDYAFGLRRYQFRGQSVVEHGGSYAGYKSKFIRFPDEGISIAVLCNRAPFDVTGAAWKTAGVVLGDRLLPDPVLQATQLSRSEARRLVGRYRGGWLLSGNVWQVFWEKRTLRIRVLAQNKTSLYTLTSRGGEEFVITERPDISLRFECGRRRVCRGFRAIQMGSSQAEFARTEASPPDRLREFQGTFTSPELDPGRAVLTCSDDKCMLNFHKVNIPLVLIEPGVFTGEQSAVEVDFVRNGRIDLQRMRLSTNSLQGLIFLRQ